MLVGFIFNKKDSNLSNDISDSQLVKDKMNRESKDDIKVLVDLASHDFTKNSILKGITTSLERKKYINTSFELYRNSLLYNLVYFREISQELRLLTHRMLKWDYIYDNDSFRNEMKEKKINIHETMDSLLSEYHDLYFEKYLRHSEGTTGLENEYVERSLFYSLQLEVCTYIVKNEWQPIRSVSGKWIVKEIDHAISIKVSEFLYFQ